jgi:hypothetical protein
MRLDESNLIDKKWIEGIRKSWKAWTKQADKFPGFVKSAPSMDYTYVQQVAAATKAYLDQGTAYIKRLRDDLLINKGFWTRPMEDGKGWAVKQKGKVIDLLDKAQDAISDGTSKVQYWAQNLDSGWAMAMPKEYYDTQEKFDRYIRTISGIATEAATNADAVVSRQLLRHLTSIVTDQKDQPIDFPSYEPSIVKLGSATLVFNDSSENPARKSQQAHDPDMARHPMDRSVYIQLCKEAEALLKRRGLGYLWYGKIEFEAQGKAAPNQHGASLGRAAEYWRQGDKVVVYADPAPWLPRKIVHELGHRYWYKFMDNTDRERFSDWFGKVSASTSYGSLATEEDFAEVFVDYVMGTDLTRDQIDRLKEFLGRKRRSESAELRELVRTLKVLTS